MPNPKTEKDYIPESAIPGLNTSPIVRTYLNAVSPATWTKPANLKYVIVEVQGGGGGGGGMDTDTDDSGGGGYGGGYCKKLILAAALGATETVTVGGGGAAGINQGSPTAGGAGGTSSFGSHCSAAGGAGGTAGDPLLIYNGGGVATGGDINITGGGAVVFQPTSGAKQISNGGDSMLGKGGVSQSMTGNRDDSYSDPVGYGSGAQGGYTRNGTSNYTSPGGAPGIVIVTEYYI